MPQLDQFTYLSQFVWLALSFMTYYVFVYNYGLPKISRIFKLRARFIKPSLQGSSELSSKSSDFKIASSLTAFPILAESFQKGATYLSMSVTGASVWCDACIRELNESQLEPVNKTYVRSLVEMTVAQNVKAKTLEGSTKLLNSVLLLGIRSCK